MLILKLLLGFEIVEMVFEALLNRLIDLKGEFENGLVRLRGVSLIVEFGPLS